MFVPGSRSSQFTRIATTPHQLHSSRLEHVGLVSALAGLCREISAKYKIEIQFTHCDLHLDIPKDIALCLFRVAQEALGNVVKHSGSPCAHADLRATTSAVSLRIKDDGKGFDEGDARIGPGIGLVGMHERMRLVSGTLSIKSELMVGTEIVAEVSFCNPTNGAQS